MQIRFWNSEPMFSGIFLHEILSQFSTCSLWYNALLVIRRCLKFDRNSNPYFISKLIVKYAKKKDKEKRTAKKIESMK